MDTGFLHNRIHYLQYCITDDICFHIMSGNFRAISEKY